MSPLVAGVASALAVVAVMAAVGGGGPVVTEARLRRTARPGPTSSAWTPSVVVSSDRVGALLRRAARSLSAAVDGGRAARRAEREVPVLLDQVTRQLRSGASLPVAVRVAASGRADPATVRMGDDLAAGVPLAEAVETWRCGAPGPARELAAAALGLATEAGGAVAVVLDGVTDTLRDRIALEREVAALSSQARASAAVLVAAPVAFAVLASTVDHRVADALLGHPLGWLCLLGGAALDGVGAVWMARLVGRAR